jgi:hypothetical protein
MAVDEHGAVHLAVFGVNEQDQPASLGAVTIRSVADRLADKLRDDLLVGR